MISRVAESVREHWRWYLAGTAMIVVVAGGIWLSIAPEEDVPRHTTSTFIRPDLGNINERDPLFAAYTKQGLKVAPYIDGDPRLKRGPYDIRMSLTGTIRGWRYGIHGQDLKSGFGGPVHASGVAERELLGLIYGLVPRGGTGTCSIWVDGVLVVSNTVSTDWTWVGCAA